MLASTEMHYLKLQDLVLEENVKWIDMINGLVNATMDFSSEESGFENLLVYVKISSNLRSELIN